MLEVCVCVCVCVEEGKHEQPLRSNGSQRQSDGDVVG